MERGKLRVAILLAVEYVIAAIVALVLMVVVPLLGRVSIMISCATCVLFGMLVGVWLPRGWWVFALITLSTLWAIGEIVQPVTVEWYLFCALPLVAVVSAVITRRYVVARE